MLERKRIHNSHPARYQYAGICGRHLWSFGTLWPDDSSRCFGMLWAVQIFRCFVTVWPVRIFRCFVRHDLSGFSDVLVHHDLFMFSDQVRRPCDYDALSSDDQPRKSDTTSPRQAKYNSDAGSTSESRRKNSSNSLRTHAFVICLLFVYAALSIWRPLWANWVKRRTAEQGQRSMSK